MHNTLPLLKDSDFPPIKRNRLETLQVNLGYLCNQQCLHCHVNAGPNRRELMDKETIDHVLDYLQKSSATNLDLTGGAPELNPNFRYLVSQASTIGAHVMDRCNLTVLSEPGQEDLAEFLASHHVEVIASLPCYQEENVNQQRGKGVFQRSIEGIQHLNKLGYGDQSSDLKLNLVYNPTGPFLPPSQQELQSDYKRQLGENYGIYFNELYTLTNMPIQRFGSMLVSKGQFSDYMQLLRDSFSNDNLKNVMCKSLLSIDWQGYLYDCDFNQMLNLPIVNGSPRKIHISDALNTEWQGNSIVVMDHCYGCTAGQGSSCGGALN